MIKTKLSLLVGICVYSNFLAQVGINTANPNSSANLEVAPTDKKTPAGYKGTLLSVMDTPSRISIVSPATGLIVYDITKRCLMSNNGTPTTPIWECISVGSNPNGPNEGTSKHFYYKFSAPIMTTATSYTTKGTKPPENLNNNIVGYLTNNDSSYLADIPVIDGLRMNAVFYTKGNGGTTMSPIIENISGAAITDFVLYNDATVSGVKRIPYNILAANDYNNVDPDGIVYYNNANFETSNAYFNHNGKMYRCTWWGFFEPISSGATGTPGNHHIHMTMEVFD